MLRKRMNLLTFFLGDCTSISTSMEGQYVVQ